MPISLIIFFYNVGITMNGKQSLLNGKQLEVINKKVNGLLAGFDDQSYKTVKLEVLNAMDDINKRMTLIGSKMDELFELLKDIEGNGFAEYEYNVEQYKATMDWYNEDSGHDDAIQIKDIETGALKRYVNSKEVCNELGCRRDQFKEKYITLNTPEGGLHGVVIQLHHPDRNNNQPELFYMSHPSDYSQITEDMNDASLSIIDDVFVTQQKKMSLKNFTSMPELLKKEDTKNGTLVQRNYIREYLLTVQKIYPNTSIKTKGEINQLLQFFASQFGIPKKLKNLQLMLLGLMLGCEDIYFSYQDGSFFRLSSETEGRAIEGYIQGNEAFKLLMNLS